MAMRILSPCSKSSPPAAAPLQTPFAHSLRGRGGGSSMVIFGSVWLQALQSPHLHPPARSCAATSLPRAEHLEPLMGSGPTGCPSDCFGWSHLFSLMGCVETSARSPLKAVGMMRWTLGDVLDYLV